jgi:hypothetical protein
MGRAWEVKIMPDSSESKKLKQDSEPGKPHIVGKSNSVSEDVKETFPRRRFLKQAAVLGSAAGAIGLGGADFMRPSVAMSNQPVSYSWEGDSNGNFGLYNPVGRQVLSVSERGLMTFFSPPAPGVGSDFRVNYSNSLFGSGIPRIAFAMKWARVLSSQSFSVISPQDWEVVYLMVGHLKVTGYTGISPITFTVNYTDPPGDNFTATLCSIIPTQSPQNTDFSPVCEDIHTASEITIAVNLPSDATVTNMQGYLTFIEVDRRPGGEFNKNVPDGMDTGDANQQLMGFSIGEWDGQLI